jgi:hypothetical protein
MPRFQSKNGRRIRHSKVITQASNQSSPSNIKPHVNTKPNLDNVNKTIQEVQGGATPAKLDKMVSNAVESNRKLQKFIKFSI